MNEDKVLQKKREEMLAKKADRKRKQRLKYSEEKKEQIREKQRNYARAKRANLTEEELNHIREQSRQSMREKRATLTEEELNHIREQSSQSMREKRATLTEEELNHIREQSSQSKREKRANLTEEELNHIREQSSQSKRGKRANLTEKELHNIRKKNSDRMWQRHHNVIADEFRNGSSVQHNMNFLNNTPAKIDISSFVETNNTVKRCQEMLSRTLVTPEEEEYQEGVSLHKSLVCVVCDCSITGRDFVYWISKHMLKYHKNVLSYKYHYQEGINELLKAQYTLSDPDLAELLLSPRSRRNKSDEKYMCCGNCYKSLSESKRLNKPPTYAISNGFAIGQLPAEVASNMTPLINNLVAPVRAFNYFLSFNGGRENKITGNFTFFAQDVSQNIGALQYTSTASNNPCVFIVLIGSFTPRQLDKIRTQGTYHVETFQKVYSFLHSNNVTYSALPPIENVPLPRVEQVRLNEEEDHSGDNANPNEEENICWKYWFPATDDPSTVSGVFSNQSDFAKALFVGETPTLFYHPTKIVSQASLCQLLPIAFPFGTGDVNCKRSPAVSEVDCLRHYLKLSLPQFLEGQTILIIHHIYQRRKSFLTGIAKCNVSYNGNTVANQIATVTVEELDEAITQLRSTAKRTTDPSLPSVSTNHHVGQLLRCIRTSCAPLGYTSEAAAEARNKMFALWMTFGPPSLLFTFSPCDECSFRMQLNATMETTELPSIYQREEVLSFNLSLRKSLRVKYPGACAREFDSLLSIVIGELIGWEGNGQKNDGIFGKLLAYSAGVEEQGRTSLHGHLVLWIQNYAVLQQQLFSKDDDIRLQAVAELEKYLKLVMCGSFDIQRNELIHCLTQSNDGCCNSPAKVLQDVSLQTLRGMRHREYLKKHCGQVLQCTHCEKKWDTNKLIDCVLLELFQMMCRQGCSSYFTDNLSFPLTHEKRELLALRYQFDVINLTNEDVTVKRFLKLLMLLFFNTHDWKHRKGCFKKGNECRFNIPHKPSNKLTIEYSNNCEEYLFTDQPSSFISKWYNHDGTYHNVCSYEIVAKRDTWDVFVNTNNTVVSDIFGYNNNVCMGSVNTLYYCTLYTSKSNQEDETYPYMKALEAVSSRLKRLQQSDSEGGLSSRQVGLRHLLSGINSHISSCVVSATMAWYLVRHGTRFHFSHEFKPLLLTQFESWYNGESYSQRIRHRNRKKRHNSGHNNTVTNQRHMTGRDDNEEETDVWMDSSVGNYLYRPSPIDDPSFDNMSLWEYESKYELLTTNPIKFIATDLDYDETQHYYRFNPKHPGYNYSCLQKRKNECIPKLYYTNNFPDIEELEIDKVDDVEDHVLVQRENYAKKALIMFFPYLDKPDILGSCSTLWQSFNEKKLKLTDHLTFGTPLNAPHLYIHALQILQNIQDLINMKRIPKGLEALQACTTIDACHAGCEMSSDSDQEACYFETEDDEVANDLQIQHLTECVNMLSETESIFNNNNAQMQHIKSLASQSSVVSIHSKPIASDNLDHSTAASSSIIEGIIPQSIMDNVPGVTNRRNQSIITILTRALEPTTNDLVLPQIAALPNTDNDNPSISVGIHSAITSLDEYALQQNLDIKQNIAFKTICASFMLSYLAEFTGEIPTQDHDHLTSLLIKNGAREQLLMCVTGPGGSGKSHVIRCCRMYCKHFCDAIGKPFNNSVFPITATTNAAAALLQGCTIHSAALLNKNNVQMDSACDVNWTVSKMLVIDEISMATLSMFKSLERNLKILTGKRRLLYGGLHIVFMGDFMQLAPVQGTPIYQNFDDFFWHQSLNCAVFLDACNHRFKDDPVWGEILNRIQIGIPTDDDLLLINERLLGNVSLPGIVDCTNTKLVYGCYTNKKRNEITEACFLKYVSTNSPLFHSSDEPTSSALIIKGSVTKQNKDVGVDFHKILWSVCGDDNLTVGNSCKVDPCLKLIEGYPLMVNTNTGKNNRIVKGIMGTFIGIIWKEHCCPHVEDYHGYKVNCAFIDEVEYIVLKLHVDGRQVYVSPEMFHPAIKFPECYRMNVLKGYTVSQVPLNVSLAITGHKLQGMTVDILILSEIHLTQNWLYVLLSRVTSLKGLYLMKPLKKNMFRPISNSLKRELNWLRELEALLLQQFNIT